MKNMSAPEPAAENQNRAKHRSLKENAMSISTSLRRYRRSPPWRHLLLEFCGLAADWPHRTVRLIAPVPAGSGSDFSARLFAERLSQRWGQAVIVENRPGADGVIGVSAFLSTDDDHTLLYAISAVFTVLPITHEKLPYDPVRDLVPISPTSDVVLAIAASRKKFDPLARRFGSNGPRSTGQAELGQFAWSSALRRRRVLQKFETGSRFCFLSRPCPCSPGSWRGPHRCIRSRAEL